MIGLLQFFVLLGTFLFHRRGPLQFIQLFLMMRLPQWLLVHIDLDLVARLPNHRRPHVELLSSFSSTSGKWAPLRSIVLQYVIDYDLLNRHFSLWSLHRISILMLLNIHFWQRGGHRLQAKRFLLNGVSI